MTTFRVEATIRGPHDWGESLRELRSELVEAGALTPEIVLMEHPPEIAIRFFVETNDHDQAVDRAERALTKISPHYQWSVSQVYPWEEQRDIRS
jgi:hypothetical protein